MAGVLLVTDVDAYQKRQRPLYSLGMLAQMRVRYRTLPHCGGLKIVAAIEDPAVIVRILTHPGLPARAPPRSPARRLDLFEAT